MPSQSKQKQYPPWRRFARMVAIASGSLFFLSLLVMARWILRLDQMGNTDDASLPSPLDAIIPLVAVTVASFAFPIATLAAIAVLRPDKPEDSGKDAGD